MPQRRNLLSWLTVLIVLAIPVILLALWVIPQYQVAPLQQRMKAVTNPEKLADLEKERIAIENGIRTGMIQGIGGVLIAIAAFVGYKNYRAALEKNTAERFSKAIVQLGHDNIYVRLGGIYALEQIAKDAEEKYYWPVMETLAAYVREKSSYRPEVEERPRKRIGSALPSQPQSNPTPMPLLAIDIQAAMIVLARRKSGDQHRKNYSLDLQGTNLSRLKLPPDANLQNIDFSNVNLQGAVLERANLQAAMLLEANLQGAILENANLQGAMLIEANLQRAVLRQANLQGAELVGANLQGAILENADLQHVDLSGADLRAANLLRADLRKATLELTNLKDAIFLEANLQAARLNKADLEGAQFKAVPGYGDAVGLTREQLQEARSQNMMELPDYLLQNPSAITETQPTEAAVQPENSSDDGKDRLG